MLRDDAAPGLGRLAQRRGLPAAATLLPGEPAPALARAARNARPSIKL
jgi:hypothetical protein